MTTSILRTIGLLLVLAGVPATVHASGCWNETDKRDQAMAEMDGNVSLLFRDATNCKPIAGATVHLIGQQWVTDASGRVLIPAPPADMATAAPLRVEHLNYFEYQQTISISAGSIWQSRFLMSRIIPVSAVRFVLSWRDSPQDLDLHLVSSNFHISYRHMHDDGERAQLDIDAQDGYGPETITLNQLSPNEEYALLVHQYSSDGELDSDTQVSVYANGRLERTIPLASSGGRCRQLLSLRNGQFDFKDGTGTDTRCN